MPNWRDLKRFLDSSQRAQLERISNHYYYRWTYPDGRTRLIKCSFGSKEIRPRIWKDILRKELRITQEEFNAGI